jgi:phenylalanyl-tRNA synthetase alpha subunit
MPYHKDKQQAFQAAQQGHKQTMDAYAYSQLVKEEAAYGQQLKHVKEEVNETYAQIENALEVATETQRRQLEQFQQDLQSIVNEVNLD